MRVIRALESVKLADVVLTIGNFDGVHLGHRRILETVVARARDLDPESFYSNAILPFSFLYSGRMMEKKADLARAEGLDRRAAEIDLSRVVPGDAIG